MPYRRKIPANRIEPLAYLGKSNWITPTAKGYRKSRDLQAILNKSLQFGRPFAEEVREIINMSIGVQVPNGFQLQNRTPYSDIFFMASKVFATGQKTIQLSTEWCEAFENTELSLLFRDYRQPFPTMVIEFPANYAEAKFVPDAGDYPEFIALHHQEDERQLVFELVFRKGQLAGPIPYQLDNVIDGVLEKMLVVSLDNVGFEAGGSEVYVSHFLRIALNAVIAMTYGTEWKKLDPTKIEKQVRQRFKTQAHGKDKSAAGKARLLLGTLPEIFQFDQKIKAFDVAQPETFDDSEPDGTYRKTHWRRGHWRQQAIGPGRKLHEPRWIRPTLVNAEQFKGDLKDTMTTYIS